MADRKVRIVTRDQLKQGWVLKHGASLKRRPYVVIDNLPNDELLVEEPETEIDERRRLEGR